jgi:Tol biopolymer transport system component
MASYGVRSKRLWAPSRAPGAPGAPDVYPNYSPDGAKIVFASDRMSSDGSLDIFTINADGSNLTRIATGVTVGGCADKNCVTPAWGRRP